MTLRRTLIGTLLVIGAYVFAIAAYVALSMREVVGPVAASEQVTALFGAINDRAMELDHDVRRIAHLLEQPVRDTAALSAIRAELLDEPGRAVRYAFADVPSTMRQPLALADVRVARLETLLLEVLALAELGREDAAVVRLAVADSLKDGIEQQLRTAQLAGVRDLSQRSARLVAAANRVGLAVIVWAVGWVVILLVVLRFARRRIREPLAALDSALAQVAAGNLSARVPVEPKDELGRVTQHFNEMTRVLRDRAEHQGRLAAAGELVAGIAHEVNNPLMAITLTAESRLDEADMPPDLRTDFQQIVRQARRAGTLLRGLLKFARPGERRPENVELNGVVSEALELVAYQFGVDEIDVVQHLAPDLPDVYCDGSRIEQVVVNLVSNAIQAVRTKDPPRRIRVETWETDGTVRLAVSDNGPGVAHDVAERIFLPFFTTKGGEGTGLGLYISRQVAREADGDLVLDADYRDGARFVLILPARSAAEGERPAPDATTPGAMPLEGARILIVEDEATVRRPLATFLRRRGAQVLEAEDGMDALTHLERYPVDVILLDLRMPRMNGVEFYQRLAETQAAMTDRVIVVSGDLRQLEEIGDLVIPPERVLAKPVDLRELEDRVRAVLTTSRSPSSVEPRPQNGAARPAPRP